MRLNHHKVTPVHDCYSNPVQNPRDANICDLNPKYNITPIPPPPPPLPTTSLPSEGGGATFTVCNDLYSWSRGQKNEQQNNVPSPKKTMHLQVIRVQ